MAISIPPKGDADKKIGAYLAPLSVQAQDVPNMTVKIRAGTFYNTSGVAVEYAGGNSPAISAPASNAKWVIVGINDNASISLVHGTASASPVLPTMPNGTMPLAFCYVVSTATSLGNDRVFDARPLFQSTNSVPNLEDELADRPTFTDLSNGLATKADLDGTPEYTWCLNNTDGPQSDALVIVKRGVAPDVSIRWNETLDQWEITNDGATFDAIGTAGGSFMSTVAGAADGNIATFFGAPSPASVVDSGVSLTDLVTDVDLTAALALKADDADLTTHTSNTTIHFTLPILQSDVTGLATALAAKANVAGGTFTGDITVLVTGNQPITLSSRDAGSSGLLVVRTGADAILEWDESSEQWIAGKIGSAFPILTSENLALSDLTDVEDTLAPAANEVLRFVGGEWTSDPLADFLLRAGGTMSGAIAMGSNKITGLASGTISGDALHFGQIGAQVQAYDAELAALAGLTSAADKGIQFTGVGTAATFDLTVAGKALLDDANNTAQRVTLGLVIGTDVQAYDATLASLAALGTVADRMAYTTGVDTWAETPLTSFGRSIIDDASVAAFKITTSLTIGTDVQAWNMQLDTLAALATNGNVRRTAGVFVVGAVDLTADVTGALPIANGGTGAITATAAATALGVGTGDSPVFTAVNIGNASDTTVARVSAGDISVEGNLIYRAGGTDVPVADGGTGVSTTPTNGQLLIGNGVGYSVATLTAGVGVNVVNAAGSITVATQTLKGSLGFTFGAIAANDVGTSTNTLTVTGAVVGDVVALGLPASIPAGFTYVGHVSAADTVTIRAHASASSGVGAAAANATINVIVMKYASF
jgi:hypothetical protein